MKLIQEIQKHSHYFLDIYQYEIPIAYFRKEKLLSKIAKAYASQIDLLGTYKAE